MAGDGIVQNCLRILLGVKYLRIISNDIGELVGLATVSRRPTHDEANTLAQFLHLGEFNAY